MKPTLKQKILEAHRAHPDWSSGQIARELGTIESYVQKTLYNEGRKLAGSATVRQLGIAALSEGLTLHDIRSFHYLRAIASRNGGEAA